MLNRVQIKFYCTVSTYCCGSHRLSPPPPRARPCWHPNLLHLWWGSVIAHAGGPGHAGEAGGDVGPVRRSAVPHGRGPNRRKQCRIWRFDWNADSSHNDNRQDFILDWTLLLLFRVQVVRKWNAGLVLIDLLFIFWQLCGNVVVYIESNFHVKIIYLHKHLAVSTEMSNMIWYGLEIWIWKSIF